jgi:hypothetical protein
MQTEDTAADVAEEAVVDEAVETVADEEDLAADMDEEDEE